MLDITGAPIRDRAGIGLATTAILVIVAPATMSTPASAQSSQADKSAYTFFNPTPDNLMRSLSTDRPTKSNVPYTVDAGHFQYEMDLFNYSFQHIGSVTTRSIVGPNPWLKVGLSNSVDFELNTPAPQRIDTHDNATGLRTRGQGFNDTFMRMKFNLWGNDGGRTAFAIIPNVKVPTAASGLGNGAVEGGVLAPFSMTVAKDTTLLIVPEVDELKNSIGSGYHTNTSNLINLSGLIAKDLTLYGELWSQVNFDPARTIRQYSFDTALAWTFRKDTQIDIGANFGLNRDTPAVQVYTGLARRF